MIESIADLITFLKPFHRHWLAEPSLDVSLIPADLPDGLAALYLEFGALIEIEQHPAPFGTQDGLAALSRLKRVEGMFEFAWENSGNWSARCPVDRSNPPVFSNAADVWESERRGFITVCDSLDHFLITLCLQEALMSSPNLVAVRTDRGPSEIVLGELVPLWIGGRYVFGRPSHDFYLSVDREVLVMDYAGLWVGSPVRPVSALIVPGIDSLTLQGA